MIPIARKLTEEEIGAIKEKDYEKVVLAEEKWKKTVKDFQYLSLKGAVATAELNMAFGHNPQARAVAAAEKAKAEKDLAKIEMEDARNEYDNKYPVNYSNYGR